MPRLYVICLLVTCTALAAGCGGDGDGGSSPAKKTTKQTTTTASTAKDQREVRGPVQLQALATSAVRAILACAAKQPEGRTINARTGARCDANTLRRSTPALANDLDTGQLKVQLDPGGRGYLVEASNPDLSSSFFVNHPAQGDELRGCQPPGSAGCSSKGTWTTPRSTPDNG